MSVILAVEWLSTMLFIVATRKMSGELASDPRVRLRALILYTIGSCCLIAFALFLGAWKFILYLDVDSISGLGLLTGQSFIVYYDIKGILNCRREINEMCGLGVINPDKYITVEWKGKKNESTKI